MLGPGIEIGLESAKKGGPLSGGGRM